MKQSAKPIKFTSVFSIAILNISAFWVLIEVYHFFQWIQTSFDCLSDAIHIRRINMMNHVKYTFIAISILLISFLILLPLVKKFLKSIKIIKYSKYALKFYFMFLFLIFTFLVMRLISEFYYNYHRILVIGLGDLPYFNIKSLILSILTLGIIISLTAWAKITHNVNNSN